MGRLPKKKEQQQIVSSVKTRSSQRLEKLNNSITSQVEAVQEKRKLNEKVKQVKSSKIDHDAARAESHAEQLAPVVEVAQNIQNSTQNGHTKQAIHDETKVSTIIANSKPTTPASLPTAPSPISVKPLQLNKKQRDEDPEDDLEEMLKKRTPRDTTPVQAPEKLKPVQVPQSAGGSAHPIEPKKDSTTLVSSIPPPQSPKQSVPLIKSKIVDDEEDDMEMLMKKNISGKKLSETSKVETPKVAHIKFTMEDFVSEGRERVEEVYFFSKPPLGTGLFGTVYKCKHKKTGVIRAIKRIKKDHKNAKSLDSLLKDVEVLKTLDHPNIIKVYEFYQDEQAFYIVTDLCSGGELFEQIIKEKNFNERKAAELMRQMLSAMAYCHEKGLVHCDLKPENVMFESQANNNLVKIIDFGNSSFIKNEEKLTNKFGTVYYVAPEVLKCSYNEKCDVWSLGVILYVILSGKPPFDGVNDQAILKKVFEGKYSMDGPNWEGISEDAKDLITKMLTYDYNQRISAKQCLEHKWIKEVGKAEDSKLKQPIGRRALRNLKTFKAQSSLSEAILYFVVNQVTSKEDKEDLMNTFMALDTDNDGKLTRDDLIKAYVKMGEDPTAVEKTIDEILSNIDKSEKGYIDYTEYLTASMSKRRLFNEERLTAAFNLFDEKGQGFITTEDFMGILNKGAFAQVDSALWETLISDIAGEGGKIDYDAFKKMMSLFSQNEQITQSLAH